MGLSLLWTTGRAIKKAENCFSALPYSRPCRRSGRSPALPYPPHEQANFTILGGGLIFKVKKGAFSKLNFLVQLAKVGAFSKLKWAHFRS